MMDSRTLEQKEKMTSSVVVAFLLATNCRAEKGEPSIAKGPRERSEGEEVVAKNQIKYVDHLSHVATCFCLPPE